jgi:hypothetical protein
MFVIPYLLTYVRSWALPEKLPIVQPFRNFPAILRNPKVHHRVHKSLPLVPILSQIDPAHTIASYLSKINLIPHFLMLYNPVLNTEKVGAPVGGTRIRARLKHNLSMPRLFTIFFSHSKQCWQYTLNFNATIISMLCTSSWIIAISSFEDNSSLPYIHSCWIIHETTHVSGQSPPFYILWFICGSRTVAYSAV